MITEAGVHRAVTHLVYLFALALDRDESCGAAAVDQAASLSHDGRPDIGEGLVLHADGSSSLTPSTAVACLYNDCDPETVAWGLANLGRQPMQNFGQAPSAVAWRERPSTYVACSEDLVVDPGVQEVLAQRCTQRYVWTTGHSPFASDPQKHSGLLVELAESGR